MCARSLWFIPKNYSRNILGIWKCSFGTIFEKITTLACFVSFERNGFSFWLFLSKLSVLISSFKTLGIVCSKFSKNRNKEMLKIKNMLFYIYRNKFWRIIPKWIFEKWYQTRFSIDFHFLRKWIKKYDLKRYQTLLLTSQVQLINPFVTQLNPR